MVHTSTYLFVILTFCISIFAYQMYFKKHQPTYGYGKLILICIAFEFVLLSVVVLLPSCFPVLIYGSVAMGAYVCIYYRFRQKIGGEW